VFSRRRFLQAAMAAGASAAWPAGLAAGCTSPARRFANPTTAPTTVPANHAPPFDTVVVVMLENRSFDHLLGWLPGADGRQGGLSFPDRAGRPHTTHDLGGNFTGCGNGDPDHSWAGGQTQLAGGRNDGWLLTPPNRALNDTYPIGYYTESSLPVLAGLARNYAALDGYFCSLMSETYPNRIYLNAARTDRDHNLEPISSASEPTKLATIPTIWDRLAEASISRRYYFSDVPFIGLWGLKYLRIAAPFSRFLSDAGAGTLPNVSFIDPTFNNDHGLESDQHPFADVRVGDKFLSDVFHAVRSSPQWPRTVLVITYDEWGGFFDHVVPPKVLDDTDPATVDHRCGVDGCGGPPDYRQLGFRVPCIVVSPFAPSGVVHGGPYEHTSILRMIEWRWNLKPLTIRDANARNLADVLDFGRINSVPESAIPLPGSFVATRC
jgi:phospholipase C